MKEAKTEKESIVSKANYLSNRQTFICGEGYERHINVPYSICFVWCLHLALVALASRAEMSLCL
jgi:hypothetical protein